jgi:CxxC-x17-CxxC domain-containing protein
MTFGTDRQMYDVDLSCAKCGSHISQLPFQPSGDRPVYCVDCNRAFRQSRTGGMGGGAGNGMSRGPRAPRQMYSVNLSCASCGTGITQLPFQPTGDKPVYCRDCMQARRNS